MSNNATATATATAKSVAQLATEATEAANKLALLPLSADHLKWLADTVPRTPVMVGGKNAPDALGGRIGSKAAAHNYVFLNFPGYVVPVATLKTLINGLGVFTDASGKVEPAKYNENHIRENIAGKDSSGTGCLRKYGLPFLARCVGGLTLNPAWQAAHEAATGKVMELPEPFRTPTAPVATTPAPKATGKAKPATKAKSKAKP